MSSKLFAFFYVFAGIMEAAKVRRQERLLVVVKQDSACAPEMDWVPCSHVRLECRWRIDPATGALTASWVNPAAADRGCEAEAESVPYRMTRAG